MQQLVDPRVFPKQASGDHARLIALAQASLTAPGAIRSAEIDRALVAELAQLLRSDGAALADLLAHATSADVARHLWRRLIDAWSQASSHGHDRSIAATFFALPIVIVVGKESSKLADAALQIDGIVGDIDRVGAILREHHALGGSETFALANGLIAADAIDVPRLPALLEWQANALEHGSLVDLPPAPIALRAGQEGVHLRFLCGTAFAATGIDLRSDATAAAWGMPLAHELARQLGNPGLSVLALPRPPQFPPAALQQGRWAQREIGAQLFASNAIRRLRASVGEPSAVLSAHRCASAPGGGELRLSLSSPFEPKAAEGFRCPLFNGERVGDVVTMLVDLLRDCRVIDVHVVSGVHPDYDPVTGLTLLFKPDALPEAEPTLLH